MSPQVFHELFKGLTPEQISAVVAELRKSFPDGYIPCAVSGGTDWAAIIAEVLAILIRLFPPSPTPVPTPTP